MLLQVPKDMYTKLSPDSSWYGLLWSYNDSNYICTLLFNKFKRAEDTFVESIYMNVNLFFSQCQLQQKKGWIEWKH